ncbi:MAG: hypothetical protein KDK36_17605, partial [Leptospiraceae bacterium]|nr:hypothetical protein [Leptospiraceae bacterium]
GVTKYQENSLKNTIGYRSLGTVQPSSFDSWEELRDYLHDLMKREKEKLDSEITVNKISIKSEEEIPVNI